jgi:hypothetical protein
MAHVASSPSHPAAPALPTLHVRCRLPPATVPLKHANVVAIPESKVRVCGNGEVIVPRVGALSASQRAGVHVVNAPVQSAPFGLPVVHIRNAPPLLITYPSSQAQVAGTKLMKALFVSPVFLPNCGTLSAGQDDRVHVPSLLYT